MKPLSEQVRDFARVAWEAEAVKREFAGRIGIDPAALSRFVNGERMLGRSDLDKLAMALGLRVVDGKAVQRRKGR